MRCNYCSMQELRRSAKEQGKVVTTKPQGERLYGSVGVRVLIHEPGVEPRWNEDFATWFAALPKKCVCSSLSGEYATCKGTFPL